MGIKKNAALVLSAVLLLTSCGKTAGPVNDIKPSEEAEESVTESSVQERENDNDTEDAEEEIPVQERETLSLDPLNTIPEGEWQAELTFPDRREKVDDTLALNSIAGFDYYSGQGKIYVSLSDAVTSFDMYVNDTPVNTAEISGGKTYEIDFSDIAENGRNTLQVSSIEPLDITEAVKVYIPYPEIMKGTPEEAGIRQEALDAISEIISSDIEYGFTSAEVLLENGYDVLMIRETNDVQLDNIARTLMANNYADAHIALHYDSTDTDKGVFYCSVPNEGGYREMEPVKTYWRAHEKLGKSVIYGLKKSGFKTFKDGTLPMDLTQTSYSTVPSIDLEIGDTVSDYSEKTLSKVAEGILTGINYFSGNE